jgi:hypothetical protein
MAAFGSSARPRSESAGSITVSKGGLDRIACDHRIDRSDGQRDGRDRDGDAVFEPHGHLRMGVGRQPIERALAASRIEQTRRCAARRRAARAWRDRYGRRHSRKRGHVVKVTARQVLFGEGLVLGHFEDHGERIRGVAGLRDRTSRDGRWIDRRGPARTDGEEDDPEASAHSAATPWRAPLASHASTTASLIWSQILSGCPSVTASEAIRKSRMACPPLP